MLLVYFSAYLAYLSAKYCLTISLLNYSGVVNFDVNPDSKASLIKSSYLAFLPSIFHNWTILYPAAITYPVPGNFLFTDFLFKIDAIVDIT